MQKNTLNILLSLLAGVLAYFSFNTRKKLKKYESTEKLKDINGAILDPVKLLRTLRAEWKAERNKAMQAYLTEAKADGTVRDDTGGWAQEIKKGAIKNGNSFEVERDMALEWLWEHGEKKSIFELQKPKTGQNKAQRDADKKKGIHAGMNDWTYKFLLVNLKSKNLIKSYSEKEIENNKALLNIVNLVQFT